MLIREIHESEQDIYNKQNNLYGCLFYSTSWAGLFDTGKVYGIFDKGGKLIGGFVLSFEKRKGGLFVRNMPYSPYAGFWLENRSKNYSNAISFEKNAVQLIADFMDNLGGKVISIAFHSTHLDMQPFIWKKYKVIPNYTYHIDLVQSEEDLNSAMAPERRNDIKKSIKDGLIAELSYDYSLIEKLIDQTFSRQNKSYNNLQVNNILQKFATDENSFSFITLSEGNPIAGTFCIYDRDTAYYLLSGYDNNNKHHGAGALALWNSILHAKKLGLKTFDMEGSMVKPIEQYFRGFGGRLQPYFTVNKAAIVYEHFLKHVKRELF